MSLCLLCLFFCRISIYNFFDQLISYAYRVTLFDKLAFSANLSLLGGGSFITNYKDKPRSAIFQIITVCYITYFFVGQRLKLCA